MAAVARTSLKAALLSVVGLFGVFFGEDISVTDQVSIIEGVKNSAAILFGVVAAWMALVYPDELRQVLKPSADTDQPKAGRLFKAFYLASVSLFLAIIFPALIQIPAKLAPSWVALRIGRVGLPLVLAAVLMQLWSLALILLSTEGLRLDALIFRARVTRVRRLLNRRSE